MSRLVRSQLRYLVAFASFVLLTLGMVVGLNLLVDPLWYYSGSRLTDKIYWFNLRASKVNMIMQERETSDCLLLGSSVSLLLDASNIRGYKCFNAAIDGTNAEELLVYARYFRHIGLKPRLIIVGIEPSDLGAQRTTALYMPRFITEGESPRPALLAYLSSDVFWFSLRSALGLINFPIWCSRAFVCHLAPLDEPLTPSDMVASSVNAASIEDFSQDSLAVYAELLEVWPQARSVGYIPLVNAWVVARWREKGLLEDYLETVYAASGLFDEFYDFSIPSDITVDVTQTNDGEHYRSSANDMIAARISGAQGSHGVAVHDQSYERFRTLYSAHVRDLPADILNFGQSRSQ